MLTEETVRRCLEQHWRLPGTTALTRHDGGMGSRTWIVADAGRRWVLKAVTSDHAGQFAKGLTVARRLERAGIPAGAPELTAAGAVTVDSADGHRLALLTWVPGVPLGGTDAREQALIGTTLARVHQALKDQTVDGAERFHWVDPNAPHLGLRPWVRPAVTDAVDALAALERQRPSWSAGLLHADPAPEAFRFDPSTGRCGVIDWSYALHGPLLYDVASAVMYLGGPGNATAMLEAYRAHGPLGGEEIGDGLAVMLRFRWAVQADYFAWRVTENDLTGIAGPHENEKGLEDARRALLG